VKLTRKRSAGNPHAAFDVAGAGNVLKLFQWRASSRPYKFYLSAWLYLAVLVDFISAIIINKISLSYYSGGSR